MTPLVWSPAFTRVLKQKIRRNPELREQVERTLRQLTRRPFSSFTAQPYIKRGAGWNLGLQRSLRSADYF